MTTAPERATSAPAPDPDTGTGGATATTASDTTRLRRTVQRERTPIQRVADRVVGDESVVHAGLRRAGGWLRRTVWPLLEPVTGFGWAVIAGTLVALGLGLALGWKELIVIGIVGVLLLAAAIAFIVGRNRYRIELDLAYTRVVVGERALGRIEIHSASQKPLLPATIEVPVGKALASFHLPRMKPGDVHEDVFAIPTSRRTILQVGPVRSVRGDPVGLLRRQVKWTDPVELFVHPKTVQLDETAPGLIRDLEGITTRDLTSSDIAFHALRDYVAGDDRRYIHWKSSARTGTLMVRQFEQTRRSVLALGLSTSPDDYADPAEFETAISVLGSLGLQAVRDEMDVVVQTSKQTLPATTGKRLLDALSGVEWSPRHDRFLDLSATIAQQHGGASVIMLHAGANVEPAMVRRARTLLPSQARVIAFTVVQGAKPRLQPIGDVSLATIGSVSDLPRVMRGVALQ
ncbi:Uncharacterized conserved protein, DUF58 family, contains vWF domain [Agrococcus baldri]|uniref:Uncharacterized conserved protein, DUF58 family, contains vWF domain n=1 Tax=Agrococcus baldri TaxID=153730 RepID=A0AA94KYX5_9MICO|nr:DUF58 domain-containing protein [Agrococcus baldri]SFS03314.1 Uncharacterized conserved protein, DUF58 family, contains vWF domain [Agrococcus baldri]